MTLLLCRMCSTRYAADLRACPLCGNDAERYGVPAVPAEEKTTPRRKKKT